MVSDVPRLSFSIQHLTKCVDGGGLCSVQMGTEFLLRAYQHVLLHYSDYLVLLIIIIVQSFCFVDSCAWYCKFYDSLLGLRTCNCYDFVHCRII